MRIECVRERGDDDVVEPRRAVEGERTAVRIARDGSGEGCTVRRRQCRSVAVRSIVEIPRIASSVDGIRDVAEDFKRHRSVRRTSRGVEDVQMGNDGSHVVGREPIHCDHVL